MNRLEFCRRFYRGEVFDAWLEECRGRGYLEGSKLAHMLGSPHEGRPGLPDNVSAADEFLKAAVDEGLLRKLKHNPSVEQRFFGVGGRTVKKGGDEYSRPVEYGYEVA